MPSLGDLAARFGGDIRGDSSVVIDGVGSLSGAGSRQLAFYESETHLPALKVSRAGAVLLSAANEDAIDGVRWVVNDSPRLYFARAALWLHGENRPTGGISSLAAVSESAKLGGNVRVCDSAVVEDGAVVGDNCIIGPGAVVGEGATIGDKTTLMARATVYAGSVIGDDCIIHSGAVIGADGFGFVRDNDGVQVKIPQLGRACLGDNVEVGANSAIDRGALDDTVIGNGVKIDNLVQIGHNVQVGDNTIICGCVGIAGGTVIGAGCLIGGGAGIVGHIVIGDGANIAGKSSVTRGVSAGETVSSTIPAMPVRKWRRFVASLRRLADKS